MYIIRIERIASFPVICLALLLSISASAFSSSHVETLFETSNGDPLIQLEQYSDFICHAQNSGFISVSVLNFTETCSLLWSNGSSDMNQYNLKSGIYSVTVTKNDIPTDSLTIQIDEFPYTEYQLTNDITACGSMTSIELLSMDSSITIQNIEWSVPGKQMKLTDIDHGYYSVNITDMYGCQQFKEINTSYIDTVPPQITLRPLQYELGLDGKLPILFPQDFIVEIKDNCNGHVDIFPEQIKLDCSHIGLNNIEVLAVDQDGNVQVDSFYINVIDADYPLLLCPPTMKINNCDTVFYNDPFSYDNCGIKDINVIEGPTSGTVFPNGKSSIIFEAEDNSGNKTQCETKVTVNYGIDAQTTAFEASCFSSEDGALIIQYEATHGPAAYEILNYSGDQYYMPPGTYYIQLTDTLGCSIYDTAFISSPELIELSNFSVTPMQEFNGNNGWIDVEITGGIPPYSFSWYKNGLIISQDERPEGLSEGAYTLKLKDAYQCGFESEPILIGNTTNTSDLALSNHIRLYPNPARDIINIEATDGMPIDLVRIYDITGKEIYRLNPNSTEVKLDVDSIGKGLHFIHFKSSGTNTIHKVFITD